MAWIFCFRYVKLIFLRSKFGKLMLVSFNLINSVDWVFLLKQEKRTLWGDKFNKIARILIGLIFFLMKWEGKETLELKEIFLISKNPMRKKPFF